MLLKSALSFLILAVGTASASSVVTVKPPTKEEIAAIEKKQTPGGPLQFAQPVPVSIDPSTDGYWDASTNTWTLQVTSTGAKNLNFGFTHFDPPKGTEISIKPASKYSTAPTVESSEKDYKATKQYWSPIIVAL